MNITKKMNCKSRVVAADEDMMLDDSAVEMLDEDGTADNQDTIDDLANAVDDLQDSVEEVKEDDESIEVENNIEDHFVAECDRCKGIFISAVKESESSVEYVHGTCPLCQEETDQHLRWIIRKV